MNATEASRPETDDPPELIELRHERVMARIDPDGAYVDSLTLMTEEGPVNLLLPRQYFDIDGEPKLRGTHPCIPMFGPHPELKQHGFARNLRWQEVGDRRAQHVTLGLKIKGDEGEPGVEHYRGLAAEIRYEVEDDGETGPRLTTRIKLVNESNDRSLIVAPGLHPYFALPEGVSAPDVAFYNFTEPGAIPAKVEYDEAELFASPRLDSQDGYLSAQLAGGVQIWNKNLPVNVIWTDRPQDYLCIEPTAQGAVGMIDDPNFLWPKMSKTYLAEISWSGYKQPTSWFGQ